MINNIGGLGGPMVDSDGLVMLASVVYVALWCPDALTPVRSQQFVICSIGLPASLFVPLSRASLRTCAHYHITKNFFLDPPMTLTS